MSLSASPASVGVLFEENPQPMWIFDPRTLRFLAVNDACLRVFGYSRREFGRMTLQDITVPGTAQRVARLGTTVQDIGVRPLRKKDGTVALLRVVTHPLQFGGVEARYSVHTDVSNEQAAIERELTARAWFENFFESSSECIAVADVKTGRFTKVNPAFRQMLGYSEDELSRMTFQDLTPPEHHAAGRAVFSALAKGALSLDLEKEYVRKNGTRVPVLLRCFPIRVAGKTVGFAAVVRDVTVRRRAERALRDSERLLSSVLTAAPNYIYRLDRAGRITFVNRTVPWLKRDEVIGTRVHEFLPPGMRSVWRAKIAEVFRSKRAVSFESVSRTRSGTEHVFSNHFGPLIEDGRVEAIVASSADITEQRALERERELLQTKLAESEEYWRSLLKQAPDYLIVLDRSLRIRYMNQHARGFRAADVLGASFERFVPESSVGETRAAIRRVFRSGKPETLEVQGYGDGGALRWYSCRAAPIRRGRRIEQVILACRDVTEEKKVRARFEGVFNSSRDAINYVALDGTLLEVNPAHERLTGYARSQLLNKRRFQDLTPLEYRAADRAAVRRLLQNGEPQEFEKEYIRRDGGRVPVRLTAFAVKDPAGKPDGFAAIIQDISERKILEREILEAGAREQSKLGRDLHDTLGQTLTGVSLLAKTLRAKLDRDGSSGALDAARLAELCSLAVRQARGLARGLLPQELQSAGLAEALVQLASQARDLFGIECRVAAAEDVRLDDESRAIQLYRIAQEAVHNAAKHASSPSGVSIRLLRRGSLLRLEIADRGVGISSSRRRGPGLGLGIMEHRARMIGGSLSVRRARRGGTVVVCECPIPPLQRKA